MDNFKNILISVPEWWISLHLPFTLTIGIPILLVMYIIILLHRRILPFIGFLAIISTLIFFLVLGHFWDKFKIIADKFIK